MKKDITWRAVQRFLLTSMERDEMSRVFYVCFYSDPEVQNKIIAYPSVWSKIDYVVDAIKKNGHEAVIFSIAPSVENYFPGYEKHVDELEKHVYLSSRHSTKKWIDTVYFICHNFKILTYLIHNVKREDKVLVYHSLYNRFWLRVYSALFPKKVTLEIEDVYSALNQRTSHFWKKEWALFQHMQRCICVNDILYRKLNNVPKKMISYGSYNLPPVYPVSKANKVRLVYAGVVEQERNAAFLATKAMLELPDTYELYILGFGSERDIQVLCTLIDEINHKKGNVCVYYHDRMNNEEYWKFLQSCDIALSTHSYSNENYKSSMYTFPSKILTYLANNLRVVAQRLEVLECSQIQPYLWFYDEPTPEALARTVCSIDVSEQYDSRCIIEQMDQEFRFGIQEMFEY